jgi:4-amino-4-deoxy-L-arabinose transferase-like glycosyltransferase
LYRRQEVLVGVAVAAICLVYVWWIAGAAFNFGVDEGIYFEGGRRIAAGQTVYRDFFVLTGPLTFWIEGGLASWFGTNIPILRLPLLLDVTFLAWAVYWLASRFENRWFAAGLSLVFLVFESRLNLLVVKHRWDSAALATAAVLVALAAQRRGSRLLWMLSGALVAAAAWATPSIVWVAVPLVVWSGRGAGTPACGAETLLGAGCSFDVPSMPRAPTAPRWSFASLLGGAAAVSAAGAAYLASRHALGPMIAAMRWTAANYTQANELPYGAVNLAAGAPGLFRKALYAFEALPAIVPAMALLGWAWRLWRRRDRAEILVVAPLLGVVIGLVLSAWPRWSSAQLLFVSAIPFALCGILLHRTIPPHWRSSLYSAILLIAAVSGVQKAVAVSGRTEFSTRAGWLRGTPEDAEYLEPFERRIQPGDSLFVFPYLPILYPLLDGRNPTRFLYLQPGMMTAEDERQAIAEVDAGRPRWVVMADLSAATVLNAWPGSDPARIPMEAMHGYLRSHYRTVDRVDGKWGPMTILERQ